MTTAALPTEPPRDSANAPRLFLVRHGEFPSNPLGLLDTALPGQELNETGIAQATGAALRLAAFGAAPTAICHSEAARAGHTARLIAQGLAEAHALATEPQPIPTRELPGAFEVQAGALEMRGDAEAMAAYREVTHAWMDGRDLDRALPGGETGEEVRARAFEALTILRRDYLEQGKDAVLIAHGTFNRVIAAMLGAVPGEQSRLNPLPNCGIVTLRAHGEGELAGAQSWECLSWPEHPGPPRVAV